MKKHARIRQVTKTAEPVRESRNFKSVILWQNVKALMKEKELSSIQLSLDLGLSATYIQNAIKNCGVPNVACAIKMADFFGVTVEELAFEPIGLKIEKSRLEEQLRLINEEIEKAILT